MTTIQRLGHFAEALGPYLLVELLLPGGSLIALGMWIHRRYGRTLRRPPRPEIVNHTC